LIVLGLDTSTTATAAGLRLADGTVLERRDDPPRDAHPGHATRLLTMVAGLLEETGGSWTDIGRIAVGVGPGTFTGLRVGVATARGLAHSRGIGLVGVSSLQALAYAVLEDPGADSEAGGARGPAGTADGREARDPAAAEHGREARGLALAVIDARRGEVFPALYERRAGGVPRRLLDTSALAPELVAELAASTHGPGGGRPLAVGDGAVRYAQLLRDAGVEVAEDGSPLHLVTAAAICALGERAAVPSGEGGILPDYVRRPDAELALEGA